MPIPPHIGNRFRRRIFSSDKKHCILDFFDQDPEGLVLAAHETEKVAEGAAACYYVYLVWGGDGRGGGRDRGFGGIGVRTEIGDQSGLEGVRRVAGGVAVAVVCAAVFAELRGLAGGWGPEGGFAFLG